MNKIDILIVEDELAIASLYDTMLQLLPYSYAVVSNGEEALLLSKSNTFKICILDIYLTGGINGVELSIILKRLNKDTKIFAMTGFPFLFENINPSVAGFDRVFEKPDGFKPMIKEVIAFLDKDTPS